MYATAVPKKIAVVKFKIKLVDLNGLSFLVKKFEPKKVINVITNTKVNQSKDSQSLNPKNLVEIKKNMKKTIFKSLVKFCENKTQYVRKVLRESTPLVKIVEINIFNVLKAVLLY